MSTKQNVIDRIHEVVSPATVLIKLHEDRVNYVILYYGSFNPPHIGHLEFLKHSYEHCGPDISIACALMVLRSSEDLRDDKFKGAKNPLILPREVRARLCYSDTRWPAWAAVLDENRFSYSWLSRDEVLNEIRDFARKAGIRIQYIALNGANENRKLKWSQLCRFACTDLALVNLHGRQGKDSLKSWAIGSQKWQALHDVGDPVELWQIALSTKWGVPRYYVRIIRAKDISESEVSSTEIRSIAASYSRKELGRSNTMFEKALSWELLRIDDTWWQWHTAERTAQSSSEAISNREEIGRPVLVRHRTKSV